MKQENKKCSICRFFRAYFTTGYCSLVKENNGYCARHGKVMLKSDNCDQWCRLPALRERRINMVANTIPEIYNKIATVEMILREEAELQITKEETDE